MDAPASRRTTETTSARFPNSVWIAHLAGSFVFLVVPLFLLDANRLEAFDLAIYDQSIWLLSRGLEFNTVAGIHVFGAHFSPVLYLLQPLAAIPGGAVSELVFEAWVLALGVFPLHRLCALLDRPSTPFLVLFVMHPAVFTASWYGFHPWTLAAPFLLLSFVALVARPTWWVLSFFGVVGIAFREDVGFWVVVFAAMVAIGGLLPWRQWLIGAIAPGVVSAVVVVVLMPTLSPVGDYLYSSSFLGDATTVETATFASSTLVRAAYLLFPLGLGFGALRRLRWDVAIPLLVPLVGLGLRGGNALATGFHYDIHLALGVILVAVLSRSFRPHPGRILVGSAVAAIALGALRPTTPEIGPNPWGLLQDQAELESIRESVRGLDDGARSISLPTQLVPHFSEREQVFIFPWPFDRVAPEPFPMSCPSPDLVVADALAPDTPVWDEHRSDYREVQTGQRYSVFVYDGPPREATPCGPG